MLKRTDLGFGSAAKKEVGAVLLDSCYWFANSQLETVLPKYPNSKRKGDFCQMLNSIVVILLPIFFVLAIGYSAGRAKQFDSTQTSGLNVLVLNYALPASLFVGTTSTSRDRLLQQGTFFLAIFIAFLGLYLIAWLISRFLFHHDVGVAALQAFLITVPTAPFIGVPILGDLYGSSSVVSIVISAMIMNVIQVPLTLALIEVGQSQKSGKHSSLSRVLQSSVLKAIKAPVVWVPVLAIVLVLIGIKVPNIVDKMLSLIGIATSGVSIFCSGLTLAAHKLKLSREVVVNSALKMGVQPLLMVVLTFWLNIPNPEAQEGILICALATSVIGVIFASRYRLYESEASSTLLLTSMMMIATLPLAIPLISH